MLILPSLTCQGSDSSPLSPTGNVAVMAEGERNATLASVLTNRFEVVGQSEYIAPSTFILCDLLLCC